MNAPCSGAPLTAPHFTTGGLCRWKAINKEGRHVGLDFYDLLMKAITLIEKFGRSGSMSIMAMFRQQNDPTPQCHGHLPSTARFSTRPRERRPRYLRRKDLIEKPTCR